MDLNAVLGRVSTLDDASWFVFPCLWLKAPLPKHLSVAELRVEIGHGIFLV
jgi:hypothetical protein